MKTASGTKILASVGALTVALGGAAAFITLPAACSTDLLQLLRNGMNPYFFGILLTWLASSACLFYFLSKYVRGGVRLPTRQSAVTAWRTVAASFLLSAWVLGFSVLINGALEQTIAQPCKGDALFVTVFLGALLSLLAGPLAAAAAAVANGRLW